MQTHSWTDADHVAGALCLELANTIPNRCSGTDRDWLRHPGVDAWWRSLGFTTIEFASDEDRDELAELRDAIYLTFSPIAAGSTAFVGSIDTLVRCHAVGLLSFGLTMTPHGVSRTWHENAGHAERVARISTSAVDLLTGPQLDRVRECPSCGWLFVDASRNRSRRWCSMETCGNRSKARRHADRTSAVSAGAPQHS